MKSLGHVRKFDELGRIVIPKEIRRKFDIDNPYDSVEFFSEDDKIIIKKYSPSCVFCGDVDGVVELSKKKVCKKCIEKLSALAEEE